MTVRGWHRGHGITHTDQWRYDDTGDPVRHDPDRSCGHCGKNNTPEGHDGCLGTLPGAMNACCGHGDDCLAYVQLSPSVTLRGQAAIFYIKEVKP